MRRVIKFGGTSIRNMTRIRAAARDVARLATAGDSVAVVVSAMGDATNRLIQRGRMACPGSPYDQTFLRLLATGETQSATLMALSLKAAGCKAQVIAFDHPQWPLVARDGQAGEQHLSAGKVNDQVTVVLDETECEARFRALVEPMLAADTVPVFPGFFVRDGEHGLVTLGRGGSDVSAFLVGRFLHADEVVIVTDVKGVLTGDPKVVAGTSVVPEMDAGLLSSLAQAGVQVLHPNALRYKPADVSARIVHFKDLGALDSGRPGTTITGEVGTMVSLWPRPLTMIWLFGESLGEKVGVLASLGTFLAERGISIHSLTQCEQSVALYMDAESGSGIVEDLHRRFVGNGHPFTEIHTSGPVAELTLSNRAFIEAPGVISAIADSLSRAGINIVEMVTSHADIVVYCAHGDGGRAMDILCRRLGVPRAAERRD